MIKGGSLCELSHSWGCCDAKSAGSSSAGVAGVLIELVISAANSGSFLVALVALANRTSGISSGDY